MNPARFCPACGIALPEGALYCPACGVAVLRTADGSGATSPPLPPQRLVRRTAFLTALATIDLAGVFLLGLVVVVAGAATVQGSSAAPAATVTAAVALAAGVVALGAGIGLLDLRPYGRTFHRVLAVLALPLVPLGTAYGIASLVYLRRPAVGLLFTRPAPESLDPGQRLELERLHRGNTGWLLAGVLGLVSFTLLVPGIIAAIAVPNLLNAIQRGKQKRTMTHLRLIGTAVEAYQVDWGYLPQVASGEAADLVPVLEPEYIRVLPGNDAWKRPVRWTLGEAGETYSLISLGKDGLADAEVAERGPTTDFDDDIYFSNGQFTVYPSFSNEGFIK